MVVSSLSSRYFIAGDPKIFPARRLQVIPDDLAIGAEEFMPGDLHIHRACMDFSEPGSVATDGPDAVHLVPRSFVAKHQQSGIAGRKLHVIEPVSTVVKRFHFASVYLDRIEGHRA